MATRVFADEELERLRGFPEISREELFRYFTLSSADVAFVAPGRGRGPADRLGLAVALCTLPWLGFVPDRVTTAPPVAVARLAEQLKVDAAEIGSYGKRVKTRTEHVRLVAQYMSWRPAGSMELKELDEFLLARAMEHDSPTLLFRLGCEYLISARVIRPGPVSVVERIANARAQAQRETYDRLAQEFTAERCAALDALLITDPSLGMSRLRWLATGPVEASAIAVKAEVEKLGFLRGLGADRLDMSVLPAERRRFLATMGRRLTPQALERRDPQRRYPILSTYTHVTDQHATYGTKIIVATKREAHYVLDEILGNATDLPITEHATDTHGVTLVNFGLFDLLGLQLSPRIRDLGRITLYRPGPRADAEARFPHAGPLLTRKLNLDLIAEHYDDLLRLAGSLKFGHSTASLLVGKLSASGRQNALASALKEYGAMRRTIYAAKYLSDPGYRRRIARQLNKGESVHALKRDLLYAHEGMIRARHLDTQTEQAWCLTLATNAVIAWTAEYYGLAVEQMRREGRWIDDEVLAHISPAHSENINFFGAIELDIDAELAQLGPTGYRPLRVRDTLF